MAITHDAIPWAPATVLHLLGLLTSKLLDLTGKCFIYSAADRNVLTHNEKMILDVEIEVFIVWGGEETEELKITMNVTTIKKHEQALSATILLAA